jgi:hypothetical protein
MESAEIRQHREHLARLQRRLEALERTAAEYCGREIATGTATALQITKRQIAELESAIARLEK